MKNVVFRLSRIILIYIFLFAVAFILSRQIFNIFGLEYRRWIFYVFEIIFIIGIIAGAAQLIMKIERNWLKKACSVLLAVSIFISTPIIIFLHAFGYQPLHVVIKNDHKMDAYVSRFHHVTDVTYYFYINSFFRGKDRRLHERYWGSTDNPFSNSNEMINFTWYDEK